MAFIYIRTSCPRCKAAITLDRVSLASRRRLPANGDEVKCPGCGMLFPLRIVSFVTSDPSIPIDDWRA